MIRSTTSSLRRRAAWLAIAVAVATPVALDAAPAHAFAPAAADEYVVGSTSTDAALAGEGFVQPSRSSWS